MCSKVSLALLTLLAAAPMASAFLLGRPTYKQHQKANQAVTAALEALEEQLSLMPELKRALVGMDYEDLKYEISDAAYNAVAKGKDENFVKGKVQEAVQKILPGPSPSNEIARDTVKNMKVAKVTEAFESLSNSYKEKGGSPRTKIDYSAEGAENDNEEQYQKAHQAANAALDSLQVQMESMPELKRALSGRDYEDLKYDIADAAFNTVLKGKDQLIMKRIQEAVQKILPGPSPSGEIARDTVKNMKTAQTKVSFEDIAKHYREVGGEPRTTVFHPSGKAAPSEKSQAANQAMNSALNSLDKAMADMPELKRALTKMDVEELKYNVAKAAYQASMKAGNLKQQVMNAVQKILPGSSPANEIYQGMVKNLKTAEVKASFEDVQKHYKEVGGDIA